VTPSRRATAPIPRAVSAHITGVNGNGSIPEHGDQKRPDRWRAICQELALLQSNGSEELSNRKAVSERLASDLGHVPETHFPCPHAEVIRRQPIPDFHPVDYPCAMVDTERSCRLNSRNKNLGPLNAFSPASCIEVWLQFGGSCASAWSAPWLRRAKGPPSSQVAGINH
jgi:hypothetical protein